MQMYTTDEYFETGRLHEQNVPNNWQLLHRPAKQIIFPTRRRARLHVKPK